ncbi:MAG: ParB/RepB/Spo0J family partition protein [Gammaproteobacteria bacterium]|nr:ParB/RepB/Spo0J family partition protein [Gammaproteobacteria bacterium]
MSVMKSVSPFRCRMWDLHDRIENYVTEDSCRVEIESFAKHGQLVPVLGRPIRGDPDYEVELIYGARRLFVARHINKPLTVELREISDKEAIVAMDIENRHRTDITPYERGLSYARWLRAGHFESQEDVARALKVSCSHVSRLLKLSRLPPVIVNAFENATDICEDWGLRLMEALDDPRRREATVRKARIIGSDSRRPPSREVYRELMAASAPGRKVKAKPRDQVIKDRKGAPLFRVRHQQKSVALIVPLEKVSAELLENVCRAVALLLQEEGGRLEPSHRAWRTGP